MWTGRAAAALAGGAAALACVIACASFDSSPVSVSDAAAESGLPATDGGVPPVPGPLLDDDFEERSARCGARWDFDNATSDPAPGLGLDGGTACRVCRLDQDNPFFRMVSELTGEVGAEYFCEVSVRDEVANDAGSDPTPGIVLHEFVDGGSHEEGYDVPATTRWIEFEEVFVAQTTSFTAAIAVYSPVRGDCILVDRFRVVRRR